RLICMSASGSTNVRILHGKPHSREALRWLKCHREAQSRAVPTVPKASLRALSYNHGATKPATRANTVTCTELCTDEAVPRRVGKTPSATTVMPGNAVDMPKP